MALPSGQRISLLRLFNRIIKNDIRCCSGRAPVRKCLSKMSLYPPTKQKGEFSNCKSQSLFLYNDILFPCHSGAYNYLPLGLRALEKLTRLIDEEMQNIGAQKIAMPSMIKASLWKRTGRWDTPELFKLKDRHSKEYCLGPTHEELITDMVSQFGMIPYKRLPIMLYQITTKFRDEMHPKYALLRGREFQMKDMYTFDTDEVTAKETYERICDTYCKIFNRLELNFKKVAGATGNIGGTLSHEFQLPSDIGEDTIYTCNQCGFGSNVELIDPIEVESNNVSCPKCKSEMEKSSGIEVGHAFYLGTKYSSVFNVYYGSRYNEKILTEMGCYGLGVSRILQAGVEVLSTDKYIRWPTLLAPYQVCIIPQMQGYASEEFLEISNDLYDRLSGLPNLKNEVVIDDRITMTVGKRIYQADTQGYPNIVVVGSKTLKEPRMYEIKTPKISSDSEYLTLDQLIDRLSIIETI
ncbi:prolyl-tRNA synthetase [Mactra antiquata]